MKIISRLVFLSATVVLLLGSDGMAQESKSTGSKTMADAKIGFSFLNGSGSSTGLLFGGAIDIPVDKKLFVRPELNITTHAGTPIELAGELKYMLDVESKNPYYLMGGLGLWFYSGGSAVGLDFTAGTIFSLSNSTLQIPAEFRFGPIFQSGNTVFQVALTSGVRFSLQ
jgi:hypothetical protein